MAKKKSKADKSVCPEIAFYYPGIIWHDATWLKNLLLFFDGVGLLVPHYIKDKPLHLDPAIVAGLDQHNLLHILEPEKLLDRTATEKLATAMTDIIVSGALDDLATEKTEFHQLSMSRLGYYGDEGLARMIFEELKARGLARDSEDNVSIPMHPKVRGLVLTLLSQILRARGSDIGMELSPATDNHRMVDSLCELLELPETPSAGYIVGFDLESVGVDLGPIPIDEVLDFRKQHFEQHRLYARSIRKFSNELSRMTPQERQEAFEVRQEKLRDIAADIKRLNRKAWKKPASFFLAFAGASWTLGTGDVFGGLLSFAGAAASYERDEPVDIGAYSYLFRARDQF